MNGDMARPKEGKTTDGNILHYSVGAIIKRDDKYLLIDRTNVSLGFAGLAGHIDEGEDATQSLKREVKEESGLNVESEKLIGEEMVSNVSCVHGISDHHWYVFECTVSGEVVKDAHEAKSIDWYTKDEIQNLKFEPSWDYWFKKLRIL